MLLLYMFADSPDMITPAMVYDLIILLLCAYRLGLSMKHRGIAALILRDGIGYFCAAFGANLLQMVLAALALNPVMIIICLPFALVVSTIAATTIFRNVLVFRAASTSGVTDSGEPTTGLSSSRHSSDTRAARPTHRLTTIWFNSRLGEESLVLAAAEANTPQGSQVEVHTAVDADVGSDHLISHDVKSFNVSPAPIVHPLHDR
jgi:hypothetical protein